MSEVTLFGDNVVANSDAYKALQDTNENLTGGSSGIKRQRISLNGKSFRLMVNGEQVSKTKEDNIDVVILNAAPISRTYFEGVYDPANPAPPLCWSADTNTPAPEVNEEDRQAARCGDCKQNIKGSGSGESRACRFAQRIAVALEGKLEQVYQLQLPATSIFGSANGDKMPMQAYARFLSAHNTPAVAIVTNIRFDEDASVPKLFFKAVRPLDENELAHVIEIKDNDEVQQAIKLTVSQTDGVKKLGAPKEEPKKAAPNKKPVAKKKADVFDNGVEPPEEKAVEEPTKIVKKKAVVVPSDDDLSDIIDDWDDE